MTTTTSFSKKDRFLGLYKSIFYRNIGYFGLLSVLIFVFYPLQYALEVFQPMDANYLYLPSTDPFYQYSVYGLGRNYTPVSIFFFIMILLVMPMVLALLLNSYMHSKQATDVYHSLPLRREMLLGANAAVGMSYIAIPVVVSNILIAVMQVIKFGANAPVLGHLVLDTLGWLTAAFCIYAITAFVCVLVGTTFDSFVFSGTLLTAVPAICGLFIGLASMFLYGYQVDEYVAMDILNLSPVTMMPARFLLQDALSDFKGAQHATYMLRSNLCIVGYLLLGAAVLWISMRLYRNRGSEIAGTVTSKGLLQVIIKFIGTLIGGVCIGMMLFGVSGGQYEERASYIMWLLIGGILVYAIIEAVLNRGFKTLVRSLPLGVLMVTVCAGGSLILMFGGLGYENRVPAVDKIESVEITYMGTYGEEATPRVVGPLDPSVRGEENRPRRPRYTQSIRTVTFKDAQAVQAVHDFHLANVQEKFERNETQLLDAGMRPTWGSTVITYHLKGGRSMTRRYSSYSTQTLKQLATLEVQPEFLQQVHGAYFMDVSDIDRWEFSDVYGSKRVIPALSKQDSAQLMEAIREDLSAQSLEQLTNPTGTPLAMVKFYANYPEHGSERYVDSAYFTVTGTQQKTYQFLQKSGYLAQILPSLEDCYAVSVRLLNDPDSGSWENGRSAIWRLSSYESFEVLPLEVLRDQQAQARKDFEEVVYYEHGTWETVYTKETGRYVDGLLLERSDIEAMAKAVVASGDVDMPLLSAQFYFNNSEPFGHSVLIARDRLPASLQEKFKVSNWD